MNVAPRFLRRSRQEPTVEQLPQRQDTTRKATKEFLDSFDRLGEECAYLRSENEQLDRDLKLAHERIRMVESELTNVRADRDFLQRHDGDMLNALHIIKTVIVDQEEKARASAFAPPGTGQQTQPALSAEDEARVAALANKLAPAEGQPDA